MARVLMFGRLADAAGWRERTIDARSIATLRAALAAEAPRLGLDAATVTVVVNDVMVRGDAAIGDADEVAFLPPVSGG